MDDDGKRVRQPDEDLRDYLQNEGDSLFSLGDIANLHAEVAGHNEEDEWFWIIELKDGRFLLTQAGCDFTGWDCQAWGESKVAESAEAAAMLAPENNHERTIRAQLLAQLHGEQPFGIEVY